MAKVILWLVLIAVVVRALSRLMAGVLEGAGYRRLAGDGRAGVSLVRDPVCGMFVVPAQSFRAGDGREARYFCSEKCRKEWAARPRG
jgi:YHS domain-containing protein